MITSLGVIAFVSPLLAGIILLIAYIPAIVRQMALGVFVALISLPLWSWFAWNWFASTRFGTDARQAVTIGFICIALMGFVKRLIGPQGGTQPRCANRGIAAQPPVVRPRHPRPQGLDRPETGLNGLTVLAAHKRISLFRQQTEHSGFLRQTSLPSFTSRAWYSLKSRVSCSRFDVKSL